MITTDRKIIVVADAHLGIRPGDVRAMIGFVETLDPMKHEILFLGDLFHIWAGPDKYHTAQVKTLLPVLKRFRQQKGKVHLVVGNRDVFFPEAKSNTAAHGLPFDTVARDFAYCWIKGRKLAAIHGDTVNSLDKQYLRWRKLVRKPVFQGFFNILPAKWVKRIMFGLEDQLKLTNTEFRKEFPTAEWMRFLEQIHGDCSPDLLLIGHFHPDQPIISSFGSTTGIVVPDWLGSRSYLEVGSDLEYHLLQST